MKTFFKPLAVLTPLLFLLIASPLMSTAHATTPTPASGTFSTAALTNVVVRPAGPAGGNAIVTDISTFTLTGTFSGTAVLQERYVLRADGSYTDHGVQTLTGTVNGVSGTVTFNITYRGNATSFQGHFVIIAATGGLANLHGQGTFEGDATGAGTYSGQVHFGP